MGTSIIIKRANFSSLDIFGQEYLIENLTKNYQAGMVAGRDNDGSIRINPDNTRCMTELILDDLQKYSNSGSIVITPVLGCKICPILVDRKNKFIDEILPYSWSDEEKILNMSDVSATMFKLVINLRKSDNSDVSSISSFSDLANIVFNKNT